MNKNHDINNRDEVLLTFQEACPRPTAKDIIEWTSRYPEFAEDIREHAAISLDWAANEGQLGVEIDESMRSRGHSRTLNALYNAEQAAKARAEAPTTRTLAQVFEFRGLGIPDVARRIGIQRSVLADLIGGRIVPPIGKPLVGALLPLLKLDPPAFNQCLDRTLASPTGAYAKADSRPAIAPRSYEAVINDTEMSAERKRYWLGLEEA